MSDGWGTEDQSQSVPQQDNGGWGTEDQSQSVPQQDNGGWGTEDQTQSVQQNNDGWGNESSAPQNQETDGWGVETQPSSSTQDATQGWGFSTNGDDIPPPPPVQDYSFPVSTTKLFVGNLSYSTTDDDLRNFFSEAGEVEDAFIVKRDGESKGFGFVTFKESAGADNAYENFQGKEIEGRPVKLERADPPAKSRSSRAPRGGSSRGGRGGSSRGGSSRGGRGGYRGGRSRDRSGRKPNYDSYDAPAEVETNGVAEKSKRQRSRNRNGKNNKDTTDNVSGGGWSDPVDTQEPTNAANGGWSDPVDAQEPINPASGGWSDTAAPETSSQPVAQNQSKKNTSGLSKTTIFVGNLPFEVGDEDLGSIFQEYQVKRAWVAVNENTRRRKGFGFVEFVSEEEQAKVLSEVRGGDCNGRPLKIQAAKAADAVSNAGTGAQAESTTNGGGSGKSSRRRRSGRKRGGPKEKVGSVGDDDNKEDDASKETTHAADLPAAAPVTASNDDSWSHEPSSSVPAPVSSGNDNYGGW